jgi:small-conductance mechanosensitive channel
MFARIIDDIKQSAGSALRLTSLAAAAALALFVAIAFLCAAAFVLVLQTYGLVQACLAGAAMFFLLTLIAAASYMARKRQIEREARARAAEAAKSAAHTVLTDPMLLTAGLQVIRAVGVKRLIPILAIGGIALGFLASRSAAASDETPAE